MHILFADDTPDTCALYAFAFQVEGHTTHVVGTGEEAVAAVEECAFDAIVLDVEMPQMGGIEAAERIRHLANGAHIPILMLTALTDEEHRAQALAAGANVVMYKPMLPQVVLTRLEQLQTGR